MPRLLPVLLAATISLMGSWAAAEDAPPAGPEPVKPFEQAEWSIPETKLDRLVLAELKAADIMPALPCSDAVFFRRVYLDVIGTLPEPREVRQFIDSKEKDKRAKLIDRLLQRDEFVDYWTLKWCDVLRVKAEFPINLWPNGVQAYHRWVHDAVRQNMPYDQFARELLTSSGSNFRVAPVNFYRAVQGKDPSALAGAAALTFMGVRLEDWPETKRKHLEAFFSRVAFKPTAEWKEEIILLDPGATEPIDLVLPDGKPVHLEAGEDPRIAFADWLIDADNPWLKRQIANRVWAWVMGRGIIDPVDDIRDDHPPSNAKLLAYLEDELVKSDYNLKHLYRLILNSRTYQQSSIAQSEHERAGELFAYYPARRLDAEVLIDALNWLFGSQENYESPIPEPFTYIPESHRTIALADGSISSPFLELYGRPSRDTGMASERDNRSTDEQRLHMLNSTSIQKKIERSWRLRFMQRNAGNNPRRLVQTMYFTIMSRPATPAEVDAAIAYAKKARVNTQQAMHDLAWALVNSKEFLCRH